jgi:hypothetical protein
MALPIEQQVSRKCRHVILPFTSASQRLICAFMKESGLPRRSLRFPQKKISPDPLCLALGTTAPHASDFWQFDSPFSIDWK